MRRTHARQRTVKHWLAGEHGPDALYFLRSMVSSPAIRAFFLGVIGRTGAEASGRVVDRAALSEVPRAYAPGQRAVTAPDIGDDSNDGPKHHTMNDRDSDEVNDRQVWFLNQLSSGGRCCAEDVMAGWHLRQKTTRRDIASLKARNLIEYVGSRRNGRYGCKQVPTATQHYAIAPRGAC